MSSKDRQRKLTKAWKEAEKVKARLLFPLPDTALAEFFQALENCVHTSGCQHDTRLTQSVIDALQLADKEANALLDGCCDNGGFCDCEIAGNSQQNWLENRLVT